MRPQMCSVVEPIQEWQKQFECKLKDAINHYVSSIMGSGVIECDILSITTPKDTLKNYIENPDGTMVKPSLKGEMTGRVRVNGEYCRFNKLYKLNTSAYEYNKEAGIIVKDITFLASVNPYMEI